jgi:arginyl-tRNA synthetase
MLALISDIQKACMNAITELFGVEVGAEDVSILETDKKFEGDYTLVIFPLIKKYRLGNPVQVGERIGARVKETENYIANFQVIQGYLNFSINNNFWKNFLIDTKDYAAFLQNDYGKGKKIMVEFCSPNTNKPLHLGHLRNLMLGDAVSRLFAANGYEVIPVCLYNDRGIAICKSMYAWQQKFQGVTPETYEKNIGKGDKLIGDCYVEFSKMISAEVSELMAQGMSEEDAKKNAPSQIAIEEMLLKWEEGDAEVRDLWKKMNDWVYEANNRTFAKLGIAFDKFYYESDLYEMGKDIVEKGFEEGIFSKNEKGALGIDLTSEGLDFKVLVRSNGTTVYMTQDVGMADEKFNDYGMERSVYVVGNEQDYHFKVLFKIMKKLGRSYADGMFHLSYGMVDLPTGKMKSREGTTVEAEDLIDEVIQLSKEATLELGKGTEMSAEELNAISKKLGLGALKYFLLKVDPVKKMLFDPKESIDIHGNTGPFVQYSTTRTLSVAKNPAAKNLPELTYESKIEEVAHEAERNVVKMIYKYPAIIKEAAETYNPALIANYVYDLSREYNRFYHECKILDSEKPFLSSARFLISNFAGEVMKKCLELLGIETPEKM